MPSSEAMAVHQLLLAWARWHAAAGGTGHSSLRRIVHRIPDSGRPPGSSPPIGVDAPADVLRISDAMERIARLGESDAVLMDTLRVHYLAAHVPLEQRLAFLGVGRDRYKQRLVEGRRQLRLALALLEETVA